MEANELFKGKTTLFNICWGNGKRIKEKHIRKWLNEFYLKEKL